MTILWLLLSVLSSFLVLLSIISTDLPDHLQAATLFLLFTIWAKMEYHIEKTKEQK